MRRLPVQIAFAFVMSLWLGVVVPGHQRHVIAFHDAVEHAGHDGHGDHDRDHRHDDSRCAICIFAATMSAPVTAEPTIAEHEFCDVQRAIESDDLIAAKLIPTFHGRAPPAGEIA